jgi:hypothetical protein
MKQFTLNLFISMLLLAAVFFVAGRGAVDANASNLRTPVVAVNGVGNGRLYLQGVGFRPGSLVNLQLEDHGAGKAKLADMNVLTESDGSFAAGLDVNGLELESGAGLDHMVVVATTSGGTITVPAYNVARNYSSLNSP